MSKIEWTHRPGTKSEVLNPTTGCDKVSRGCRNCYAEIMHKRLRGMGQPKYQQPFLGHVKFWPEELEKPFKWKKPRTVFLNSMSDIFHDSITVQQIAEIYAMMFLTPQHTYIVLTKRADRAKLILNAYEFMVEYCNACNRLHDKYIKSLSDLMYFDDEIKSMWPLKNVWQGVSVEDDSQLDRARNLVYTPAHIRVISYEPAVGPLNLNEYLFNSKYGGGYPFKNLEEKHRTKIIDNINWVIAGGESGHRATPSHPDWFRTVRDQCKAAGVSFFFKQWGTWAPGEMGRLYREETSTWSDGQPMVKVGKHESGNFLDGVQHLEFPGL